MERRILRTLSTASQAKSDIIQQEQTEPTEPERLGENVGSWPCGHAGSFRFAANDRRWPSLERLQALAERGTVGAVGG